MEHRNHLNAAELLPEEELRKLSDLLGGRSAYLWVPSRDSLNRLKRGDYIIALRRKGISVPEIARRLNLSQRHVQRILAKKRAADGAPASTTGDERRAPDAP